MALENTEKAVPASEKNTVKGSKSARKARLADALRANLRRRKTPTETSPATHARSQRGS